MRVVSVTKRKAVLELDWEEVQFLSDYLPQDDEWTREFRDRVWVPMYDTRTET